MMTARVEVHKFGGTSVGTPERIAAVAGLMAEVAQRTGLVVVASAMSGVTDRLILAANQAREGNRAAALQTVTAIADTHKAALAVLDPDADEGVEAKLEQLIGEVEELIRAVARLGELTPRTLDRIIATGEKLSVRLVALALTQRGCRARAMDADRFLETDDHFGESNPLEVVTDRCVAAALRPVLAEGIVPVVTGFCGKAPDGGTTTLGRGGSDYTATLLAAALRADEVTIWTDVSGVFSADPRIVPEARVIDQLNFREAAELSYYGAKVLHQRTMIPVVQHRIPVWIRNSFEPTARGTLVDDRFTPGSHPVKAISAIRRQALISVEGKGMAGVPGVAARVFGALAAAGISVTMISQSSSESSICFAVPEDHALGAESALKRAFRQDLSRGDIEEVFVRQGVALVAAVGLGMAQMPGVAARVFDAIGRRGVNVLAIAQGSSELNISLAIEEREMAATIYAIHEDFGLHRADTGLETSRGFDVILMGCGQIGRDLMARLVRQRQHAQTRFGLTMRIVAVGDRTGYVLAPRGLDDDAIAEIIAHKAARKPLAALPSGTAATSRGAMLEAALDYRLARPVLVDVTDADGSEDLFRRAFELGCDVVTANKKPLAGPMDTYRALMNTADRHRRLLRVETTVGAGLPVIDTLEMLLATGDTLSRAQGCVSGTLGFVMTRLEEGAPLSVAVREAIDLGYTEPDPVADLCGADVGRKALILGRLSGLATASTQVELTPLVSERYAGMAIPELLAELERLDADMAARIEAARAEGKVLRYLAEVTAEHIRVGPVAVPADSAIGMLRGSDNMIVFASERYRDRPLVISGPGAGVEVTAMGVLGDIFRIAAERR